MDQRLNIHFIAIGGSAMHQLAIALKEQGHRVTGSDDEIFDPAKSRLEQHKLFPSREGWNIANIHDGLDLVILGMHARTDNPELAKAKELGIEVVSFPEYIHRHARNKQRIVIAGSHGKTTITAMIMHVLNYWEVQADYLIGATTEQLPRSVKLTDTAPIIVLEGDEYLSSPLDKTPKCLNYHHHIGVISGIAWDHINVFPSFESYQEVFEKFIRQTPKAGTLIYNSEDKGLAKLVKGQSLSSDVALVPYQKAKSKIIKGVTHLTGSSKGNTPLQVFGDHNLSNLSAALHVCKQLFISEDDFYEAIASFEGAYKRLEAIAQWENAHVFKDFAHAPSKVTATIQAVKKHFPKRKLIAVSELHTFSSLNEKFVDQYKGSMRHADVAVVYYNPLAVSRKRLEPMKDVELRHAFDQKNLEVFTDVQRLRGFILEQFVDKSNLLLMSSGDFGGLDLEALTADLEKKVVEI